MHGALILSRVLRSAGESTRHLERGTRDGRFVRVRPGAFIAADTWEGMPDRERHLVAVEAFAATSRSAVVFSGESAAALLGIPLVGGWPRQPRVAVGSRSPRRARVDAVTRWNPVPTSDVVAVGDLLCTCPAATALDLAVHRDLVAGVAAVDHVMRVHGITLSELQARVEALRPFRGVRKVDAVLGLATGLAENPFESLSRVRILQLGFEPPQEQVEFRIDGHLYRVDFFWPRLRIVGEADGRVKYQGGSATTLWEEKLREDALRTVVDKVVRWDWDEAWLGGPLARKLERAGLRPDPRNASKYAFRM